MICNETDVSRVIIYVISYINNKECKIKIVVNINVHL